MRIERERLPREVCRPFSWCGIIGHVFRRDHRPAAKRKAVRGQFLRGSGVDALRLDPFDLRREAGHDGTRHLGLHFELRGKILVEVLGPDLPARGGVDQVCSDPHALGICPDASLDDVADAKFARYPAKVAGHLAIDIGRVARHDEEVAKA